MGSDESPVLRLTGSQRHFWNDFEGIFPHREGVSGCRDCVGGGRTSALSDQESALIRRVRTMRRIFKGNVVALERNDPCGHRSPRRSLLHGEGTGAKARGRRDIHPEPDRQCDGGLGRDPAGTGRIIDPGVGSARFLMSAAQSFPKANLIGIDLDPLAALIARANLVVSGLSHRSQIVVGDYRNFSEKPKSPLST